ncbi:MAG: glycerophosphodiester phosphodiesterase family protein [Patescibacteria group bacterium]|nr:glycerophosphodiester phosphodiesterase family protein [Patescibacteria group bacterium]
MKKDNIIRIGHRGACGYEPENTLRSFRKAIELGVEMTEFDVYVCATGELVVIHDDKVDRTTNGTGYVFKKTFSELRQLDAGQGEKIPTLEEVLDVINRKAKVNIELKGVGTAKPVAETIIRYQKEKGWLIDDFLVSSFNHHELKAFHDLLPEIPIGALITGIPLNYAEFAEKLGAQFVNVSMEFVTREFVDDAHQRGLKIAVFTVNEPDDFELIKAMGVDGVFSNFPDRI